MDRSFAWRCAHHFFDFSLRQAEKLWEAGLWKHCSGAFTPWPEGPAFPATWEEAERIFRMTECPAVVWGEANYPEALSALEQPPPVLYYRGRLPLPESAGLIAMVGTRKPSSLGKEAAASFGAGVARAGLGIVSGLALGIDTLAHAAAVEQGTYTTAVLGSGWERFYPRENRNLAEAILATGGTLLTEYPPHVPPLPYYFPRRNRLIAALGAGTIVIEAAVDSGAFITGTLALGLDRPVAVLPQDYRTPAGRGALRLQETGASGVADLRQALEIIGQPQGGYCLETLSRAGKKIPALSLGELVSRWECSLPRALARIQEWNAAGRLRITEEGKYILLRG